MITSLDRCGVLMPLLLLLAACYEIPPRREEADAAPLGRVPMAVYASDPFHPWNLWFDRAFGRVRDGAKVSASEYRGPRADYESIDIAEMIALVDGALDAPALTASGARQLASDVRAVKARLDAMQGAVERASESGSWKNRARLLELLKQRLASALAKLRVDGEPSTTPPPLRSGEWTLDETFELPAHIVPTDRDNRPVRVYRSGERVAIVRYRRVDGDTSVVGDAVECILLDASALMPAERWVVDRVLRSSGEDGWIEAKR